MSSKTEESGSNPQPKCGKFPLDTTHQITYRESTMNPFYELVIDFESNITFLTYPHTREGLNTALKTVKYHKSNLLTANIVSSRDGVVFSVNKNTQINN